MGSQRGRSSGLGDLGTLLPSAPATFLIAFACIGVFLRLRLDGEPQTAEDWARWGVVDFERLFEDRPWGLLSSCVVHVAPLHLLFNLWWLWDLGVRLEGWLGTWKYVALVVASGLVSSWAQAISGDWLGHGYSGVNYALFGFAWLSAPRHPELTEVVHSRNVTLMMVWLAGCFVATELGTANIGNGAHLGGLVFGALLALALVRRRAWSYGLLALLFAALGVGGVWRPWSPYWSWKRGLEAQRRGDSESAEAYFRTAQRAGFDDYLVATQLVQLHAIAGDSEGFRRSLAELRALDPLFADAFERYPGDLAEARSNARAHENSGDAELYKGRLAAAEQRYEDAGRHFTAQLDATPGNVDALCGRASAVLDDFDANSSELAQALLDALTAIEASKRADVEALSLAAEVLRRKGDFESARQLAEEADALVRAGKPATARALIRLDSFGLGGS